MPCDIEVNSRRSQKDYFPSFICGNCLLKKDLPFKLAVILLGHFKALWESFPIQNWPIYSQLHVF